MGLRTRVERVETGRAGARSISTNTAHGSGLGVIRSHFADADPGVELLRIAVNDDSTRLETAACGAGTLTVTKEGYKTLSKSFTADCRADAMAAPILTLVHTE